ncbi:hypothetical protein ACFVVU_36210 [Kitasatospora sp. NPDC057965]|uniref:hypothetical protein n=1 Tax=Kitasatospora sp. NPDC057965 TaxID=3346291 RepID=UPI0036DA418A
MTSEQDSGIFINGTEGAETGRPLGLPVVPSAPIVHEVTVGAAAKVLAARGGAEGLAASARRALLHRSCRPSPDAVSVATTTANNGFVRATARVECADQGCAFEREVQVQREILAAMLEGTREIVAEAAERALLHSPGGTRSAAWTVYQQTVRRALGELRDKLELYTGEAS